MISRNIEENLKKSSWIRAMFEQGTELKKKYGQENVFDFTLGNPDPEPGENILATMEGLVREKGIHKYMANAGYLDVREAVADFTNRRAKTQVMAKDILMVSGAAGGLNVTLKALLNPGEEVIVIAPFFSEYRFYIENHNGVCIVVPAKDKTFNLDIDAIAKAITKRTKAIIINSPNNPSGTVYDEKTLKELAKLLSKQENTIYLLADEPYKEIIYDDTKVPQILDIYKDSIVINSFSKSLALPGQRIGYCIIHPECNSASLLMQAMIFANRTLGFVNAPSLLQKTIAKHLDDVVGLDEYKAKRDALYKVITEAGFECELPKGAFYLFPKCPIEDDGAFAKEALKHNIVLVGGTGFSYPGYLRLAYCVSMETIKNSKGAFCDLMKKYKQ